MNIGKIKKGTRNISFDWGLENTNDFTPSSTTLIISKDWGYRKNLIEVIINNAKDFEIKTINLFQNDENNSYRNEDKTFELLNKCKDIVKERYKNYSNKPLLIAINNYDLELYHNKKSVEIRNIINYINDMGLLTNTYLLLGVSTINTGFLDNVDNIILLAPYNIEYLEYLFNNSIYKIMEPENTIQQFCKANGISITQITDEPNILKNGNRIYLYTKV